LALPTLSAARRAVTRLLLTAGRAGIDQYFLPAGPTAANLQQPEQWRAAARWYRRTED